MSELEKLPNIGKTLADKLAKIGVNRYEELAAMGSVQAVLRLGARELDPCINTLYALEGAIRGIRWHAIPGEECRILVKELEGYLR